MVDPLLGISIQHLPLEFDSNAAEWLYFSAFGLSVLYRQQSVALQLEGFGRAFLEFDRIVVDADSGLSEEDRRLFVQGTIQGIYDIFHGCFPLHASAVALDQGAILFTGQSGAGKSTHAAYFLRQGHALVSDDVSRVDLDEQGKPEIRPAIPQMKLWDDALRHFGEDPDALPTVPGRLDKRRLTRSIPLVPHPLPVRAIIHLVPVDQGHYSFGQLKGMAAYEVIAQNIYRGFVIPALGKVREHFAFCSQLAGAVPVLEVRRPTGHYVMDQVYADLTRWLDSYEIT